VNIKLAGALVAFMLASGAASAQPGWYGEAPYAGLSSREVLATVRAAGLRPITHPGRYGDSYVVYARDRYGDTKRVMIDAEFGDIVRIVSVGRRPTARYGFGPPRRWWGDGDEVAVARPPAPIGRRWRDPYDERPRASLRAEPDEEFDETPRPRRPAARQPHEAPHTAAVNPVERVQPPVPRARPAVPPAEAKAPAAKPAHAAPAQAKATPEPAAPQKPQATTPKQTAAPRVVYPGGPTPKSERAAETATRSPDAAEAPKAVPKGGIDLPPVQPLE
jgi:hypothetical protein